VASAQAISAAVIVLLLMVASVVSRCS
jgi:hypothetical protein